MNEKSKGYIYLSFYLRLKHHPAGAIHFILFYDLLAYNLIQDYRTYNSCT